MADLVLNQALTTQQQNAIKHIDLDSAVRWVAQYALENENDWIQFMFRVGMPGRFPNGEWGYTLVGDSGMHMIPEANELDHRTSFRYGELPRFDVKLKSLWGVMCPMTLYSKKWRIELLRPEQIKAMHIAAVSRALPNYFKYLSFSIFAGSGSKGKRKPLLRHYINKYIEPSDGAQNGYPFYLSDGYGEINLSKVIAKDKVKQHALKTELDRINKIIYKEANKVDAELKNYVDVKPGLKQAFSPEVLKSIAVYHEVNKQLREIIANGYFDKKYKVDSTKFEGYNAPVSASDIVVIINKQEWIDFVEDHKYTPQMQKVSIDASTFFQGVNVLFNDDVDRGTAVIMDRRLMQFWILPSETRYIEVPYIQEQTTDLIYETMHTMDIVPIYCSMWVKFKST